MKEEAKKILSEIRVEGYGEIGYTLDIDQVEELVAQIHNLYKLKLPENPYGGDHLWTGFDYCLEQVKEQNKELL